ncbi:FG-GAP-like repeat-containing protein [Fontisphaera persica]|uniref:FG-GAP-like repeat-containing protein n=1 Tax=Fontisphaera persica TaxID=2974023 RepID=UPI0024C0E2DD|nr:FG-GAP-like repeat-containing protein [Fontisphaera persica]WCJ60809.1 FG-GAP-like repeat-containing protein [Fontisphaera persica]
MKNNCGVVSAHKILTLVKSPIQGTPMTYPKMLKTLAAAAVFTGWAAMAQVAQVPFTLAHVGGNPVGSVVSNAPNHITLYAAGNDIWDMQDEFTFLYLQVTGDFDIKIRVASMEVTARWPKAGIMARPSLDVSSKMVFSKATPSGPIVGNDGNPTSNCGQSQGVGDLSLMYRTWRAGEAGNGGQHEDRIVPGDGNHPTYQWVRLQRVGSVFRGYASMDGVNWVGPQTQDTYNWPSTVGGNDNDPFPNTIYVGIAGSRHGCAGETGNETATTQIYDNPEDPVIITVQPAPVSVTSPGGSVTLRTVAMGWPVYLVYQWKLNGVDIPNATNTTYTFTAPGASDSTNILTCVVSNTYNGTVATSANAEVRATKGPRIAAVSNPGYGVLFIDLNKPLANLQSVDDAVAQIPNYCYLFSNAPPSQVAVIGAPGNLPAAFTTASLANNRTRIILNYVNYNIAIGHPYFVEFDPTVGIDLQDNDGNNMFSNLSNDDLRSPIFTRTVGPMQALSARGNVSLRGILISFNQALAGDLANAQNPANYTVNNGVNVISATVMPNGTDVLLYTTMQDPVTSYTVTVQNIADMVPTPLNFTTPISIPGYVLSKRYDNDRSLADLKIYAANNPPAAANFVPWFEYPDDGRDNFQAIITGWIVPAASGSYRFYAVGDDDNEFWLSPDDNPANRVLLTRQSGWTGFRNYNKFQGGEGGADPNARSAPVQLYRGMAYSAEVLFRDGTGGGHVSVGYNTGDDLPTGPIQGQEIAYGAQPGGPTTVAFTQHPQNTNQYAGLRVTFTVAATGANPTGPIVYQWQSGGVGAWTNIPGANAASYQTPVLSMSDNGKQYRCVAVNLGGSLAQAISSVATLTVQEDTIAPVLLSAEAYQGFRKVRVVFSEPVEPTTAENPANYAISGGITVLSAARTGDGSVVILDTSLQDIATQYTLTVNNVDDFSPLSGAIAPNSTANFTSFMLIPGKVKDEAFTGIGGSGINDLKNNSKYINNQPDTVGYRGGFDVPDEGMDNYGRRLSAFIIPPTNGNYRFYMASDDDSEFYLSTDDNPANKTMRANLYGWTDYRAYDVWQTSRGGGTYPSARSEAIALEGGKLYYAEAIMKEGGGGDHIAVAMAPEGSQPGNGSPGMIGWGLFPVTAGPTTVTITTQPQDRTGYENARATFTCVAQGSNPSQVGYQWQVLRGGTWLMIPGAVSSTYQTPVLTLADNGTQFRCLVYNPGGNMAQRVSAVATLTVLVDSVPPTVESVSATPVPNKVLVRFGEAVPYGWDSTSAYTLMDGANSYNPVEVVDLGDTTGFLLTFSGVSLNANQQYTLRVENVYDQGFNLLETTNLTFTGWHTQPGFVQRQVFTGNSSAANNFTIITNNSKFPYFPDSVTMMDTAYSPKNYGDYYSIRMIGWFIPPETAVYNFRAEADDSAWLLMSLSPVHPAHPANAATVIRLEGGCAACNEPGNWSGPVSLVGGVPYYFELLMQEGGGGDYVSLAFRNNANYQTAPGLYRDTDNRGNFTNQFIAWALVPDYKYFGLQPVNITVSDGNPGTVVAAVHPYAQPATYQWQRFDGTAWQNVAGATNASYTKIMRPSTDQGAQYRCVATFVDGTTATSAVATVTVLADTTPPTVAYIGGSVNYQQIMVRFSERMDAASVAAGTYTLTDALNNVVPVLGASLMPDAITAILTTTPQEPGAVYTLTLNNVRDASENANAVSPNIATYTNAVYADGIYLRRYDGFGGTTLPALTNNVNFPNNPSFRSILGDANYRPSMDNYGALMSGVFVPPTTGNYKFWLRNDDDAGAFLGTTMDYSSRQFVAFRGCCNDGWNDGANTLPNDQAVKFLIAGFPYYWEAMVKEGGGGDYLEVGYTTGASVLSGGAAVRIPRTMVYQYGFINPAITLTTQPQSVTTNVGATVTLSVAASGSPFYTLYQWQRNGVNILGARSDSYTTPALSFLDNGVQYRCLIVRSDGAQVSQTAVINVNPTESNPLVLQRGHSLNGKVVGLVFNDAVAIGTLTNLAQIQINTLGSPVDMRPVTGAGDVVTGFGGTWPGNEHPGLAVDGLLRTKYLNFGKLNTGFIVQLGAGAKVVKAVRFTSANDAPERDPIDFILEGSNDGSSWTVITNSPLAAFQSRGWSQLVPVPNNTAYGYYRVTFPNVANAPAANSMQIGEVELLEQPAAVTVVDARLNRGETNTIQLTLSSAINGPFEVQVSGLADLNGNYMTPSAVTVTPRGLKHANSSEMVAGSATNPSANWPGTYGWNVMGDENTIQAWVAGSDIWGSYDAMNFTYREINGDFVATVRILGLRNAGNWTKAGLMARPGLAAHERQRAILATPAFDTGLNRGENAIQMTYRDGFGGGSTEALRTYPTGGRTGVPPLPYPNVWVKLMRSNGMFYAFHSLDGTTWVANGQYNDGLPTLLNVGLASSAVNNNDYTIATYQDFQVQLVVPAELVTTVAAIDEDSMATINVPGHTGNRTYEIVSGPAHGQVLVQGGQLIYIPDPNFNGLDTFTYRAIENGIASGVLTINVPVTMVEDAATRPYAFTNSLPLAMGAPPRAVVTADFVKDNKLDLAVAIPASNVVALLKGNGKGDFTNRFDLVVGNNPIALTLGDFNYDRRPDLAVLCAGDRVVQIWQNNGVNDLAGALTLVTNIPLTGNNPVAFIAADLNKDLFVDLVVVDAGNGTDPGTVEVFYHQRMVYAPVFDATEIVQVGRSPSAIAAGLLGTPTALDKPDLVVANAGNDNVSILTLVGTSLTVVTNLPVGDMPAAVGVVDINLDKLPDILVANMGSDDLTVWTNASNPKVRNDMRFAPAGSFGVGMAAGFQPRDLAFGDYNNDKLVDVAIALMGADAVLVMHGNGMKSLTNVPPLPVLNFYWGDPGMISDVEDMPVSLASGDYNADKLPDLAVANWGAQNVSILLNNWAPKAYNQKLVFVEDMPTNIVLGGSYGPLDYYITVWPTNGVLDPSNGLGYLNLTTNPVLKYTPLTNRFGRDLIKYYVSDGVKTSKWAMLSINILPVNDQPVIQTAVGNMGTVEAAEDVPVKWTNFITYAWAGPWGEEKQRLSYFFKPADPTLFKGKAGLPRIATTNLTLFFTPTNNAFGETLVELWAKDSGRVKTNNPDMRPYGEQDTTVTQVFIIRITNVNDAPVFVNPLALNARTINEDGNVSWRFNVRDIDSDINSLTVSLLSTNTGLVDPNNPAHWNYTKALVPGTNLWEVTLNVTPAADAFGRTMLTVVLSDGTNTSSRTVGLIVQPVNDKPNFVLTRTSLDIASTNGHASTNVVVDITASNALLGPANEVNPPAPLAPQRFQQFRVVPSDPAPFVSAPTINPLTGGLVIRTKPTTASVAVTLTITAVDSGGTLNGGVNTSDPQTFTLRINP